MPPTVLVIDSVAVVAIAIAKAIEAIGACVSLAASLKAADRLVKARFYDFAILDADINGTSSETLARTLASRGTAVIVCTTDLGREAAWTKDYRTLPKPINFDALSRIVGQCQS